MGHTELLVGFFASLAVTVVVLGAAIAFAKAHRVTGHIRSVVLFLVCFVVTVVFAELLGPHYDLAEPSKTIHLSFATFTAGFVLAPLVTGYRHHKGKGSLGAHKAAVGVWLVGVVAALATGGWMLQAAELIEPASAGLPE